MRSIQRIVAVSLLFLVSSVAALACLPIPPNMGCWCWCPVPQQCGCCEVWAMGCNGGPFQCHVTIARHRPDGKIVRSYAKPKQVYPVLGGKRLRVADMIVNENVRSYYLANYYVPAVKMWTPTVALLVHAL